MAQVDVKKVPRFKGSEIVIVGFICMAALAVLIWLLLTVSNVFDETRTTTTGNGGTAETTTNDLATAQFAVVVLIAVGALVMLGGFVLALTEVATEEATATTPDPATGDITTSRGVTAAGAGAVLVAVGELARGLGEALRGLKTSAMLVLMGGLLMIMSGVVAWQTIPGTDRNPTITVTDDATAGTTTTTRAGGTSTTSTTLPGTTSSTRTP